MTTPYHERERERVERRSRLRVSLSSPAAVLLCLLLPVHAAAQTIEAFADRQVVPEGSTANVLIKASLSAGDSPAVLAASLQPPDGFSGRVMLSSGSAQLTSGSPSALLTVFVRGDDEPQYRGQAFRVELRADNGYAQDLSFTIPPSDLEDASMLSEVKALYAEMEKEDEATVVSIRGRIAVSGLQDLKSFIVVPSGNRFSQEGIISFGRGGNSSSFTLRSAEAEGIRLTRTNLNGMTFIIRYLDALDHNALDPSARMSAQISAGTEHVCAVRADNRAECWGSNLVPGVPEVMSNQAVPPKDETFLSVSAGNAHSCAIKTDSALRCWGADGNVQSPCKEGETDDELCSEAFLSVSAGGSHTCAVRTDGTLQCWGSDADGRAPCKEGETDELCSEAFLSVSTGSTHTCAVGTDGTLRCWGENNGSIGGGSVNGPNGSRADGETFLSVSAGSGHTCAVRTSGTLRCWGADTSGSVNGPNDAGNETFLSVSAGSGHTCAVRTGGGAECWGNNGRGQASPPDELRKAGSVRIAPDTRWLFEKDSSSLSADSIEFRRASIKLRIKVFLEGALR